MSTVPNMNFTDTKKSLTINMSCLAGCGKEGEFAVVHTPHLLLAPQQLKYYFSAWLFSL